MAAMGARMSVSYAEMYRLCSSSNEIINDVSASAKKDSVTLTCLLS